MSNAQQLDADRTGLPASVGPSPDGQGVRAAEGNAPLREADGYSRAFLSQLVQDLRQTRARRARALPRPGCIAPVTNLAEINRRTSLYVTTGNRDHLIDVARYAMAEYIQPSQVPCGMGVA